jgi:hypothetical protein
LFTGKSSCDVAQFLDLVMGFLFIGLCDLTMISFSCYDSNVLLKTQGI